VKVAARPHILLPLLDRCEIKTVFSAIVISFVSFARFRRLELAVVAEPNRIDVTRAGAARHRDGCPSSATRLSN